MDLCGLTPAGLAAFGTYGMHNGKKLRGEEGARAKKLCQALLHERGDWAVSPLKASKSVPSEAGEWAADGLGAGSFPVPISKSSVPPPDSMRHLRSTSNPQTGHFKQQQP